MPAKMSRISTGEGRFDSRDSRVAYQVVASTQSWSIRPTGPGAWDELEISGAFSVGGAELIKQDDHSILSRGPRPERDAYLLTSVEPLTGVTGIRLEVLTDGTLPHKGPGRQDNGNLHLSAPSADSVLLTVRDASIPAARLALLAERAGDAARRWLERLV